MSHTVTAPISVNTASISEAWRAALHKEGNPGSLDRKITDALYYIADQAPFDFARDAEGRPENLETALYLVAMDGISGEASSFFANKRHQLDNLPLILQNAKGVEHLIEWGCMPTAQDLAI